MENDNKKIVALIDNLMSADSLEQPSQNFTDNVMSKIDSISNASATVYKPLISKPVWFLILGSFVALVCYIYFKEPAVDSGWFDRFDLSNVSINPLENVSFHFSKTLIYAVVFLAIMVSIQVPVLKHYFNKRMSI